MEVLRTVVLFGDASHDLTAAFESIVSAVEPNTILQGFLGRVHAALQHEWLKLSPDERSNGTSVDDLRSLFRPQEGGATLHPALQAAQAVTIHLASFISAYERNPHEPYPTAAENIIAGICLGELSASAVSLASSLTELCPLAVESVRVAFRTGLAAERVSRELEPPSHPRLSWSVALSRESGVADPGVLDDINATLGFPRRNRTYISSYGRSRVTLSGPPTSLKRATARAGSKAKPAELPLSVPYHATHLYTPQIISEILDVQCIDNVYSSTPFASPKGTLISGSDGQWGRPRSRKALLENALGNILISPLSMEKLIQDCQDAVGSFQSSKFALRPFGPIFSLGSLLSALRKDEVEVDLDDGFWAAANSRPTKPPLAIVGIAGRFPQANNHDELWQILMQGRACHTEIPKDRFDPKTHLTHPAYGCFIESPGMFDSRFFNMSPREALQTEPGQRLSLVTAYEALEMAGFVPNRTPSTQLSRIGTFYGQTVDEYKEQNMAQDVGTYFIPGSLRAFGPGRINRHFKFGGPASSFDTVCSSSSVALNAACSAIWGGDCDTAVAGGANILSSADNFNGLIAGHFLSPTGGCKTFDDGADGYCRAETVASVVIKRLDAALADKDNVLGVILSAATNYSADAVSITHPHEQTQCNLYKQVLHQAGIQPFDVDYIEMHGTGTQAGDACEMESVTRVFAPQSPRRPIQSPLWVGAVKSNIGHSEAASGITSLVKALLVLREEALPPHIGISGTINRNFTDLSERHVRIPVEKVSLPTKHLGSKRRILVNNFGAAGGNTAIIVEEPPRITKEGKDDRSCHIVNVTAKTLVSLRGNIQQLLQHLDLNPTISLSDLSYTTTARRIQHPLRVSIACSDVAQLKSSLKAAPTENVGGSGKPRLIFAFTGQGAFYVPLAKELYQSSRDFRASIERLDEIVVGYDFPSVVSVIDGTIDENASVRPVQIHLSILIVEICIYRFLSSRGVRPDAVIGHSLGEYAALCVSEVLTPADAIYLVGKRAELLESRYEAGSHKMLAVNASVEAVLSKLGKQSAEIACINGPTDTVLSGTAETITRACETLKSSGMNCTLLDIPYGFHSAQMDPILPEFEALARTVPFRTPKIPLISPLLKTVIEDGGVIDPTYLRRHTRETVDFAGSIGMAQEGGLIDASCIVVETGPHPLCTAMIRATLGRQVHEAPCLKRKESSLLSMAQCFAILAGRGVDIDWTSYHRDYEAGQTLLDLPSYRFDEKNFWIEYQNDWLLSKGGAASEKTETKTGPATTTVQRLISESFIDGVELEMLFESDMSDPALHDAIIGHSVNGSGLCPASIHSDIALTIADYIRDNYPLEVVGDGMEIADMTITHPITVPHIRPEQPSLLRISVSANLNANHIELEFGKYEPATDSTKWSAKCRVVFGDAESWLYQWSRSTYLIEHRIKNLEKDVTEGCTHKMFRGMVYRLFASCVDYDPKYQAMQEVLLNSEGLEATAVLDLHQGSTDAKYFCSPFWIDAFIHLAGFVLNANDAVDTRKSVFISGGWGSLRFAQKIDPSLPYRVHVKMIESGPNAVFGDVSVLQGGKIMVVIGDLKFQRVPHTLLDMMIPPAKQAVAAATTTKTKTRGDARSFREKQHEHSDSKTQSNQPVEKVFEIIADQAGLTLQEIFEINSFEAMGIDSLLSMQIAAKVHERLGLDFDHSLFQTHATAKKLQKFLVDQYQADESSSVNSGASNAETSPSTGISTPFGSEEDYLPQLYSTLAEQLGVEMQDLFDVQDLTELGLDSLMWLNVCAALQDRLGVELNPEPLKGTVTLSSIKNSLGLVTSTPNAIALGEGNPEQQASVVLQNRPSAGQTIFLFPDGSGSPAVYSRLTFSNDQNVIALQSPFVQTPRDFNCGIETMAKKWMAEIRRYQPTGPYVLIGYSAGGYYAFEAARQLLEDGANVEHLILIDSPSPTIYEAMDVSLPTWLAKERILPTSSNELVEKHFVSTIKAVEAYRPAPIITAALQTTIIWASQGATPNLDLDQSLPAETREAKLTPWLLKRPKDSIADANGWDKLLPGQEIPVKRTSGHHFNLLSEPNCRNLSSLVQGALLE